MSSIPRADLASFPNSPYAAELQRGGGSRAFGPEIEAEYVRAHLRDIRTLIRAAAALAALTTASRIVERELVGMVPPSSLLLMSIVLAMSVLIAALAFSRAFERFYLAVALFVVPLRNVIAAVGIMQTAAHGELEALMIVPLLALGRSFSAGCASGRRRGRSSSRRWHWSRPRWFSDFRRQSGYDARLPHDDRNHMRHRGAQRRAIVAQELPREHLIEELAHHDTLTGLKNRRVFDEQLERLRSAASSRIDPSRSSWSTSITSRPTTTGPVTGRRPNASPSCAGSSGLRHAAARRARALRRRRIRAGVVRHRPERGRNARGADAHRGRRACDQARGRRCRRCGHDQHRRCVVEPTRNAARAARYSSRIRRCTRRR